MKMVRLATLCGLLLAGLISCSKGNEEGIYDPLNSMYETYTGKQGTGAENPENFFQLKLEENGSLFAFNNKKEMDGAGLWEINGEKFQARFRQRDNNMIIHLAGSYDAVENTISGTWGYGEFTMGGGSFSVGKEIPKLAAAKAKNTSRVGALIERLF